MSSLRGWPSSRKPSDQSAPHATIEPTGVEQYGLTVNARVFAYEVGTDLVEAGSNQEIINATGHLARVGDVIRFLTGTVDGDESKVVAVTANTIQVADKLRFAPGTGNTFAILRPRQAQVDENGNLIVTAESAPIQYVRDGVDTEVSEDTAIPLNSRPLPVKILKPDGSTTFPDTVETRLASIQAATEATAFDLDTLEANFGRANQGEATTDTGTFSLIQLFKRLLQGITTGNTTTAAVSTGLGAPAAAVATTDTGTFSLIALFKRSLQTLTTINTSTVAGNTLIGAVTETAPATDTASSGLNGRLQRIAQRLTSLIAQLPATLGAKASSASLSVVLATDQAALPSSLNANGSVINQALSSNSTPVTFVAPANAVGFILMNESVGSNPGNVRFRVGGAASPTAGMVLEPGRDTGVIPIGTGVTISVINIESSITNALSVLWILRV